jgi:hypothetical protein
LNAGQVGAIRASMYITGKYSSAPPDVEAFAAEAERQVTSLLEQVRKWFAPSDQADPGKLHRYACDIRRRMSQQAAQIRKPDEIKGAIVQAWEAVRQTEGQVHVESRQELPMAFRTHEMAVTHAVYLEAIARYIDHGGASRGSYLILDPKGNQSCGRIGDVARFSVTEADAFVNRYILELWLDSDDHVHQKWVPVRPIPAADAWFETVWKDYLEGKNFLEAEA